MTTTVRLGVFVAGLAVAFAAALGIGRATGPVGPIGPADEAAPHAMGDDAETVAVADLPGGLASSQDGYTLTLAEPTLAAGRQEVAFTVTDDAGKPVTAYDVEHEKLLHLIVVRRDLTGFQHVHPELDDSGTWRADVELTPGSWRVFADFTPSGGEGLTLGTDLAVPGAVDATTAATPTRTDTVDGYTVTVEGDLAAGELSTLELTVRKDGEPVTDLEPYLGSYGHLVALREGDLAYLHVHPEEGPSGPTVEFGAEVPSAGRYHLYLDFQHGGVVRTATLTLDSTASTGASGTTGGDTDEHDDPHSGDGEH